MDGGGFDSAAPSVALSRPIRHPGRRGVERSMDAHHLLGAFAFLLGFREEGVEGGGCSCGVHSDSPNA